MIYEIIDEQGRYCGFKADLKEGQTKISHTYSYIYARKLCKMYPSEKIRLELMIEKSKEK